VVQLPTLLYVHVFVQGKVKVLRVKHSDLPFLCVVTTAVPGIRM